MEEQQNQEQLLQNQPMQSPVPDKRPKRFKYILFIIICFILILSLASASYYFFVLKDQESGSVTNKTTSTISQDKVTPTTTSQGPSNESLDAYQNKELVGANEIVSAYILNPVKANNDTETSGELLIYNRLTKKTIKMDGNYSFFGSLSVHSDNDGKYVMLSEGTYVYRGATIYSTETKKMVGAGFGHMSGLELFWNDYFIYFNNDRVTRYADNPRISIAALNMKTGQTKIIAQADDLNDYNMHWKNGIFGSPSINYYDTKTKSIVAELSYTKFTVTKNADWADNLAPSATTVIYDLNNLLK